MIHHNDIQQCLTTYVSATDYPGKPNIGLLGSEELLKFYSFFKGADKLIEQQVYYVGLQDGEHTFTDALGYAQYLKAR
jgi:hypothetical protein